MSSRDSYDTPPEVYAYMNSLYDFVMDVAASDTNHLHKRYLTEEQNALALDWRDQGAEPGDYVWCNPPYSDIGPWVSKATEQAYRGVGTVMMVMADQSVGWFAEAIKRCSMVLLVTGGRLSFIDPTTGKPAAGNNKGSMFLIWNPGGLRPHQRMATEYVSRDSILEVGRGWIDSLAAIHSQPTAELTETVDNLADSPAEDHPAETDEATSTAKPLDEWFWDYQHGDSLSLEHGQWPRFVVVLTILSGILPTYTPRQVANAISICDEQLMEQYTNLTQEQQERIRRCAMALAETEKTMSLTDTNRQLAVTALLPRIDESKLPLFESIKIMREAVQAVTTEGEAA